MILDSTGLSQLSVAKKHSLFPRTYSLTSNCEICGIAKFQLFWNCSETSIEKKILQRDERIY